MSKLEIAILAGAESKQFLASFTQQVDRLEAIAGKLATGKKTAAATTVDADEENEIAPTKKSKKGASFDDADDEPEVAAEADEADADEEESFEAPPKKAAGKKKLTVEDVNAACKARAGRTDFKSTKALLKKKFKVDSVQDLKPEQYAQVIAAMKEDEE